MHPTRSGDQRLHARRRARAWSPSCTSSGGATAGGCSCRHADGSVSTSCRTTCGPGAAVAAARAEHESRGILRRGGRSVSDPGAPACGAAAGPPSGGSVARRRHPRCRAHRRLGRRPRGARNVLGVREPVPVAGCAAYTAVAAACDGDGSRPARSGHRPSQFCRGHRTTSPGRAGDRCGAMRGRLQSASTPPTDGTRRVTSSSRTSCPIARCGSPSKRHLGTSEDCHLV